MDETETRVVGILAEIRPDADFEASDDYIEDGLLDSTDIVAVVVAIDQQFGISIDGTEIVLDNFRNAAAIRRLLAKHGR
jgi:acyl carrier protein